MLNLLLNNHIGKPLGLSDFTFGLKCAAFSVGHDTKYTNQMNLQIARENNQAQIDLWKQQQEYDYNMWKANNAYNSPQAQSERLQAAGINPALALSNISTGTSASTAGGQTPPTLQAPTVDYRGDINQKVQNLALIGKQLSDIGKQSEETRQLAVQNNWQNVKNGLEVAKETKNLSLMNESVYQAKRMNHFMDRVYDAQVAQEEEKANMATQLRLNAAADGSLKELQKDYQKYMNDNIQPLQYKQMLNDIKVSMIDALTNRMNAITNQRNAATNEKLANNTIKLTDKQVEAIDSQISNTLEDTKTKQFWNGINQATRYSIIQKTAADATNASLQPFWQALGTISGALGSMK